MKAQKTLTHFIGDRLGKKSLYFLLEAKKSSREQKTSGRFIFSSFLNIPRQSYERNVVFSKLNYSLITALITALINLITSLITLITWRCVI